jgi:hypothetical protein
MKVMKIRANRIHALLAAALALIPAAASGQANAAGTSPFTFLELRYDARSIALAGASAALPSDGYGVFSNPATLGYLVSPQAVVGYRAFDGVYGIPLAYLFPENGIGVCGIGVCGLSSGNIAATDIGADGSMIVTGGNAYLDDYGFSLSWAKKVGEFLSAGVTAKTIYEYYKDDGQPGGSTVGLAVDAGCQGRFMNSRLMYGFVARNIGAVLSGYDKGYPLPAELAAGISYVPKSLPELRVMVDVDKKRDDELNFEPGGEFEILKNQLFARAGYSFSWSDLQALSNTLGGNGTGSYTRNTMTGFCCGVGFKTPIAARMVAFDAAVEFLTIAAPPNLSFSMLAEL